MSQPNNNNDDDHKYKKIFVGGLAWKVTTDVLRNFFQEYCGEVLDANVVNQRESDGSLKSKGYGFVTFRDAESATRACQPPYPEIEGRQTNVNLAYLNKKNNHNHSNQTGVLQRAGPSHQYQHGPFDEMAWHQYQNGPFNQAWHQYQNGWFNQVAWHQYPQVYSKPHFQQVNWDPSHYGAYRHHMYGVSHYPSSSTVNFHQTNGAPLAGVFQQPGGATLEELVDTETDSGVQHPNGKDQEGEISGQDNGINQDVKDEEGKINEKNNGIKQDFKDQGEINGQDNGIKQDVKGEEGKIVSGEDENTKQGAEVTLQMETGHEEKSENTPQENCLDHEEKTQHIEAGLITKKDKNA